MKEVGSYRTILRSSSVTGLASIFNILTGLIKMKLVAVLLGPAGVGLIGVYQSLIQTASTIFAVGLDTVGTRQIAEANSSGDRSKLAGVGRALIWGTTCLALLGSVLFWLVSGWIATNILAGQAPVVDVAWLSFGVALTVASGSQGALLAGMRRIGDLARVQIATGILSTLLGILAIYLLGKSGLLIMVLVVPLLTFVFGLIYSARVGSASDYQASVMDLAGELHSMVFIGAPIMLSGLVATASQLAVRTLVQRELGANALGQFQSAWAIGMVYLGVVLGAMGTDFYPRLTGAITDLVASIRLVNEQTEVALLICAPVLLAMLGFAPWIIGILYSGDFAPAADILRWQFLGDILKVMSWPLGFLMLAAGAGRSFLAAEAAGAAVFVISVAIGLPVLGVVSTGVAFLALYILYLPLVWWIGRRRFGFAWSRVVRWLGIGVFSAALVVEAAARISEAVGALVGAFLAAGFAIFALLRLSHKANAGRMLALRKNGPRIKE